MKLERLQNTVTVTYTTKSYPLNKLHKSATGEILRSHKAEHGAARAYVTVLESRGTAVGAAVALLNATRAAIHSLGLPMQSGGMLVPSVKLDAVESIFAKADRELAEIRVRIIEEHPRQLERARPRLHSLLDSIIFPCAEDVASGFGHRIGVTAAPALVPDSALENLAEEVRFKAMAESRASLESVVRGSYIAPFREVLHQVTKTAESLRNGQRFRGERLDSLRDSLEKLVALNFFDLSEVGEVVSALSSLAIADRDSVKATAKSSLVTLDAAEEKITTVLADLGF